MTTGKSPMWRNKKHTTFSHLGIDDGKKVGIVMSNRKAQTPTNKTQKNIMKITENQKKLLIAFSKDDHVNNWGLATRRSGRMERLPS